MNKPMLFWVSVIVSMFLSIIPIYFLTLHSANAGESILLVIFAIYFVILLIVYPILSKLFSMNIPGKATGFKFIHIIFFLLAALGVVVILWVITKEVTYKSPQSQYLR